MTHREEYRERVRKLEYRERVRNQTLQWALGKPMHNNIDGECCPDFSCCHPDMFEKDDAARWAYYRKEHGNGRDN